VAVESVRLAEAHRLAQLRLGIETIRAQRAAWPLLDLVNLSGTEARWLRAVTPLIEVQSTRSARLAADYLRAARALDVGVDASYAPVVTSPNPLQIATSMRTQGPVEVRRLTAAGRLLPDIGRSVFVSSSRAGARLAMDGGRGTIAESVAADPEALGYARVGSRRPCGFCSMLISRGPVYSEGTVGFRAHDNCSCGQMAVYRTEDGWTDDARRLRDVWNTETAGLSGVDAINAFRRAVEAV
jgi:hypothetical protein